MPVYYTAYTPCFRKEAGSADARDTRVVNGIAPVHMFDGQPVVLENL